MEGIRKEWRKFDRMKKLILFIISIFLLACGGKKEGLFGVYKSDNKKENVDSSILELTKEYDFIRTEYAKLPVSETKIISVAKYKWEKIEDSLIVSSTYDDNDSLYCLEISNYVGEIIKNDFTTVIGCVIIRGDYKIEINKDTLILKANEYEEKWKKVR